MRVEANSLKANNETLEKRVTDLTEALAAKENALEKVCFQHAYVPMYVYALVSTAYLHVYYVHLHAFECKKTRVHEIPSYV